VCVSELTEKWPSQTASKYWDRVLSLGGLLASCVSILGSDRSDLQDAVDGEGTVASHNGEISTFARLVDTASCQSVARMTKGGEMRTVPTRTCHRWGPPSKGE
jgi:hypothetical protein